MSKFDIYNFQPDDLHELLDKLIRQAHSEPTLYIYRSLVTVPQQFRKRMEFLIRNELVPLLKQYKAQHIDSEIAEQIEIFVDFEHHFYRGDAHSGYESEGWVDEWYIQAKHKGSL